ncbi:hypothetical protein D3C85_1133250 [compost metagenome]
MEPLVKRLQLLFKGRFAADVENGIPSIFGGVLHRQPGAFDVAKVLRDLVSPGGQRGGVSLFGQVGRALHVALALQRFDLRVGRSGQIVKRIVQLFGELYGVFRQLLEILDGLFSRFPGRFLHLQSGDGDSVERGRRDLTGGCQLCQYLRSGADSANRLANAFRLTGERVCVCARRVAVQD